MLINLAGTLIYVFFCLLNLANESISKPTNTIFAPLCYRGQIIPINSTTLACQAQKVQQNIIKTSQSSIEFSKPAGNHLSFSANMLIKEKILFIFTTNFQMEFPLSRFQPKHYFIIVITKNNITIIDLAKMGNILVGQAQFICQQIDPKEKLKKVASQFLGLNTFAVFSSTNGLQSKSLAQNFHKDRYASFRTCQSPKGKQILLKALISGKIINSIFDVIDEVAMSLFQGIFLQNNFWMRAVQKTKKFLNMLINHSLNAKNIEIQALSWQNCKTSILNCEFQKCTKMKSGVQLQDLHNSQIPKKQKEITKLYFLTLLVILLVHLIKKPKHHSKSFMISLFTLLTISMIIQGCNACSTVPNCVLCSADPNVCQQCSTEYFMSGFWNCKKCSTQIPNCKTCDPWWPCLICNDGYYVQWGSCHFDPATCPLLANCKTCTNPTTCIECITNDEHYLDATDSHCYPCSTFDSNCLKCSSENFCSQCKPNFVVKSNPFGTLVCQPCSIITHCLECSSYTTCTLCEPNAYLAPSGACGLCSQMEGCLTCSGLNACSSCDVGWTFDVFTGLCRCDPTIYNLDHCQACSDPHACITCEPGYYLQVNHLCQPCSNFDTQCLECSDFQKCTLCDVQYGVQINSDTTTTCLLCSDEITNCVQCLETAFCTLCDPNYYITDVKDCQLCSDEIPGCLTCSPTATGVECNTCDVKWQLILSVCVCNPSASALSNCMVCQNPSKCTQCEPIAFYLDPADFKCKSCSNFDTQCLECSDFQKCTLCDVQYGVQINSDTTTTCLLCSDEITNCVQCLETAFCTLCDPNYYITDVKDCQLCSDEIPGCLTCSPTATGVECNTCDVKWQLILSVCVCNPSASALSNCMVCQNPSKCTQCEPIAFYLDPADFKCKSCSNFDTQCLECSDFQKCTLCDVQYGVQTNADATTICLLCSSKIQNCVQCLVTTVCTLCDPNYYIKDVNNCKLCSQTIAGCLTCSPIASGIECKTCGVGWQLISSTCVCDPLASSLNNCMVCQNPSKCTQCEPVAFYLDPTDFKCYPCSNFDPNCLECDSLNQCSKCGPFHGIKTYLNGTKMCLKCNSTLKNCTQCLVVSACTNCNWGFGINSALACSTCGSMIKGCVECETSLQCLGCESIAFLIMGQCKYCSIPNCKTCVSDGIQLSCAECSIGFYLTPDPVTGKLSCRLCNEVALYCITCNSTECFSCESPYLMGSDKTCSACQAGYEFNNGLCTNITGCQSIAINAKGQQFCIACVQSLNFVMDQKTKKCICTVGYESVFNRQQDILPKCQAICGDGIVISQKQKCDDNNTISNDGCSSTCTVEPDFDCGTDQPSICQLRIDIESITFNQVYRQLGKNQAIMSFLISPIHSALSGVKWEKLVQFNFSSIAVDPKRIQFKYSAATGELFVTVSYNEELEAQNLQSSFTLDPKYILSKSTSFTLKHSLKGVNAPLIFEEQSELETQKSINLITLVLTIFLLLQFYAGSYSHKMIGLETIQIIQSIYFVRIAAGSSSSSLMNSMNSIQYSAGGYHNAQIFYGDTTDIELNLMRSTPEQFIIIDLKRFFLLNANLSLFPVVIAIIVFIVTLIRKYRVRNHFIQTKEQQVKDSYTNLRRSSQWVYDHFVFPYIMLFSLISFFQTTLLLQSPSTIADQYKEIENLSFLAHIVLTLSTIAIYCFELFSSYQAYSQYRMTESEKQKTPQSTVEKLEHDDNNLDRANYHPAYIFSYLIYYFLLSLCMASTVVLPQFPYALEANMGLAIVYFLVILIWRPYSKVVNAHNHFLKFNHGTFVVFLGFCYVFTRLQTLESSTYTTIMYLTTVLIACVMSGGFIRIYIEFSFRKALEQDGKLLGDIEKKEEVQGKILLRDKNIPKISKRETLIMNNQYTFENQLIEYEKRFITPNEMISQAMMKNLKLSGSSKKEYLIKKMRQQIYSQKLKLPGQPTFQKATKRKL